MGKAATKHVQNDHNGFANFCCIIYEVVCANSFLFIGFSSSGTAQ